MSASSLKRFCISEASETSATVAGDVFERNTGMAMRPANVRDLLFICEVAHMVIEST